MPIHISRSGQQYGPYELDYVNASLQNGSLLPTDLAWSAGMAGWVPLAQYSGVQIANKATTAVPPPMPTQATNQGSVASANEEDGLRSSAKTLQTLYAVLFGLSLLLLLVQFIEGFTIGWELLWVLTLGGAVACRLKRTSIVNRMNQLANSRGGPSSI